MAKHKDQRTHKTQEPMFLFLAVLALAWGVSSGWAGQQPSNSALPTSTTVPSVEQKAGLPLPVKSAHASAERRMKTGSSLGTAKRDPFKLPEIPTGKVDSYNMASGITGVLPPGVRGLLISQLKLEGVVREQTANKMIAVVTNDTKRAYFLTENEAVYNGVVSKITPDSVYFNENVLDPNGRVTTREVVKRLGSAPGEGR